MKKLLLAAGLLIALTSGYAPTASAGGGLSAPDYTIDCSLDTDLTSDNRDELWADYVGETITVYTTNCDWSCAFGDVDQVTDCGNAFFDNGSPRTYEISGPASIHAYVAGVYGAIINIGLPADEFGFAAEVDGNNLVFTWMPISSSAVYRVELASNNDYLCFGELSGATGSCSIALDDLPNRNRFNFNLVVIYDFTGIGYASDLEAATLEVDVRTLTSTTTVDQSAVRNDSTLADTGSASNSRGLAALALGLIGLLLLQVVRNRRSTDS